MNKKLLPVDIIIVNYNGVQYIDACLDSLFKTDYPHFSVILVDNGSHDGSLELVQKKYPEVTVILNNENLGFGKANAIGINAGKSEFVALLNSDTIVKSNWLFPLVETLMEDNKIAAACSKLLFMENPRVINGVGGGMNYIGYGYDIGMYENDNSMFNEKKDVFFPCAAACLLRKSIFEEIGGFDAKFFMYHEDVDFGWRLWLGGYQIKCVPDSIVYHAFGGSSFKVGSMDFRNKLGLRHALRSLIKNYELTTLLRVLSVFVALGIRTSLKERSLGFIRCILWNLTVLPDTLKKRRQIQKSREITDRELSHLIWQDIRLPVQYPDYNMINLKTFIESGNKRNLVDTSDNKWASLGYGWYGLELYFGDGKTKYRWSKDEAVFYLWNKYGRGMISMDILALSKLLNRQRRILVSINNKLTQEFIIKSDDWGTIKIPYDGVKGALEVKIKVEDTWSPDDLFKNSDRRKLGIGLKKATFITEEYSILPIDGISIIIPTHNRVKPLLKTLRSLENQSLSKDVFEITVVDDGSTDTTESEVKAFINQTSLNISYLKQANKKQGAARNLGIKHSTMPLLVFIGDDIMLSPNFLGEHLNYHKKNNKCGNTVVIGQTQWSKEIKVTPFMEFIGEYGYQFGYSLIKGEGPLPFNFFYTSNISVLRTFLDELEYIFEEDFTTYGWEDIELGYRLESIDMKLFYNQNAVAYHYHPMDIASFCIRQFSVGRASRIFLRKHPELRWFLGNFQELKRLSTFSFATAIMKEVLNLLDKKLLVPFPRWMYDIVLKSYYAKGAITAKE